MIVDIRNEREFCIWLAGFIEDRIEFGEDDIDIVSEYLTKALKLDYDNIIQEMKREKIDLMLKRFVSNTNMLDELTEANPENWADKEEL